MQKGFTALTLILIILVGCNNADKKFPTVRKLAELRRTVFVPTLENKLLKDKNSIYCSSLLYAWDEVRRIIETPLKIDSSLPDLYLLNNSKSYLNTLNQNEYSVSGDVDGSLIQIKAEFKKALPFELTLTTYDNELTFDKVKVASFGGTGNDYMASEVIQILYYKNNNNFILKLSPKEKEHEIILYMTQTNFKSMSAIIVDIEKKIKLGLEEIHEEDSSWKYFLKDLDEVVIPKLAFDIETNYSTLEGKKFQSVGNNFEIEEAWQRTAFIFDENGAEIESESEIAATSTDSVAMEEKPKPKPKPKKMRFNKPFFIMLKRTDSLNPYFGLWVSNTELMTK